MDVTTKRLNYFKNKIRMSLEKIKDDLGDLRYELYLTMVDRCDDYKELREMAELEMQLEFIEYTRGQIMKPINDRQIDISDLNKVCYGPDQADLVITEQTPIEDDGFYSAAGEQSNELLALALQRAIQSAPLTLDHHPGISDEEIDEAERERREREEAAELAALGIGGDDSDEDEEDQDEDEDLAGLLGGDPDEDEEDTEEDLSSLLGGSGDEDEDAQEGQVITPNSIPADTQPTGEEIIDLDPNSPNTVRIEESEDEDSEDAEYAALIGLDSDDEDDLGDVAALLEDSEGAEDEDEDDIANLLGDPDETDQDGEYAALLGLGASSGDEDSDGDDLDSLLPGSSDEDDLDSILPTNSASSDDEEDLSDLLGTGEDSDDDDDYVTEPDEDEDEDDLDSLLGLGGDDSKPTPTKGGADVEDEDDLDSLLGIGEDEDEEDEGVTLPPPPMQLPPLPSPKPPPPLNLPPIPGAPSLPATVGELGGRAQDKPTRREERPPLAPRKVSKDTIFVDPGTQKVFDALVGMSGAADRAGRKAVEHAKKIPKQAERTVSQAARRIAEAPSTADFFSLPEE